MSLVNRTSSTFCCWELLQQKPAFHELSLGPELGKTAMQPTLSHLVLQPDNCSCPWAVPPRG